MDICIAYTPMPSSQSPNIICTDDEKTKNTYYEMIVVSFYSLRKYNLYANLILVSTELPPPIYLELLEQFGVVIDIVPFKHKPPEGFAKKFVGSFYLLDAIISRDKSDCLYLDPDVICLKSLDSIFLSRSKIWGYLLVANPTDEINGVTLLESARIARDFYGEQFEDLHLYKFFGGEFYYIPELHHFEISCLISKLYNFTLTRFSDKTSYYPTEEHILSAAFSRFEIENASPYIKRIWTAPSYRNVNGYEKNLALLHFPAEKEYGFKRTFRWVSSDENRVKMISDEQFERFIISNFQLKRRSIKRIIFRAAQKVFIK